MGNKKKLVRDISMNTMQVLINQFCGFCIFYILSRHLDKNDFGELNWSLAILLTLFGILACGIDQIFVKRIASGYDAKKILPVYCSHVLLSGTAVYGLLWVAVFVLPDFFTMHQLLLLIGIGKLMTFFSTPFKQLATGIEKFGSLLFMTTFSNLVRSIALLCFAAYYSIDLKTVIIIFAAGDLAELILCLVITRFSLQLNIYPKWNRDTYGGLLKESLPQLGVAVFTSIVARLDWILLGIFTSNIILANYSFAYKIFEMATLPMLVIAPVLIPRFTKIFHPSAKGKNEQKIGDIFVLLRIEMIIASLSILILNILWTPLVDHFTNDKYGAVNEHTFLLLSATMPLLYFNNFLWTINFAQGHLKMIFFAFALTFSVNVIADSILIIFYKAEGAAIGYLLAIAAQSVFYLFKTPMQHLWARSISIIVCPGCALVSGYIAICLFNNIVLILISALLVFLFLLIVTKQIRIHDWLVIKRIIGNS